MVLQEVIVAIFFFSLLGVSVPSDNRPKRSSMTSECCWRVTYTPHSICALRGSTVELHSTYSHPPGFTLTNIVWHVQREINMEPTNITQLPTYSNRVEYIKRRRSSTLRIRNLTESDSTVYRFRFLTNSGGKYTGEPGIQLSVTGLEVKAWGSTDAVTEGQNVELTCSTTCALWPSPTYVWYKNGQPVPQRHQTYKNYLNLISVSREDSGNYSCAVKGKDNLISSSLPVDVRYPPENTSAYVCPPGETSEGSSVTLVCRSDANPPVHTYIWYQKTRTGPVQIGSAGQNYSITNVSSEHSGDYYCTARNMLNGAISATLKLDVKYPPRSPQTVLRPAGDLVEGSSMTLTCSSEAHPPVHTYTWYRGRGADSRRVGGGQNYSRSNMTYGHSGEYHCQAENLKGSRNSTTVFVDVLYPPRNVSLFVSSVDGSITLTCTSDANPPVQNYTWHRTTGADTSQRFMETTGADSSQRGTGRRLTLEAAESGIYYCEAMNEVGASRSNLLPISEKFTARRYAVVVVIVAIGALIVISSIWLRKKHLRVTEITEGTDDSEQDGSSPVYVNVSRMAMASDPKKDRADTENEILYSSVHFKHRDKQEVSFNSTLQNPKLHPPEDDNEALYCTVKFHQP